MPAEKISKMPKRSRSHKDMTQAEIQALLSKLKEIVPNMPRNRKLSKLEIIQNVIDYIVDLQIALESHPVPNRGVNMRLTSPGPRQPLGVIPSESNNIYGNIEENQTEKIPTQTDEGLKTYPISR